ncbi:hypothetical protein WME73_04190 [Sorangium sp. So ce302]
MLEGPLAGGEQVLRVKLIDALSLGLADGHHTGERASVTGVMVGPSLA